LSVIWPGRTFVNVKFDGAAGVVVGGVKVMVYPVAGRVLMLVVSDVELTASKVVLTERKFPFPVPAAVIPMEALGDPMFVPDSWR
jgi:hypothetical protein